MKMRIKSRRLGAVVLMAAAVFAVLYVPLVASTERWRVGGNDIIPHLNTWRGLLFGRGPKWYLISSAFGLHVSLLILSLVSGFVLLQFKRLRLPIALVLVSSFFGFRHWAISARLEQAVESCGNHSRFWMASGYKATVPLPDSTEFDDFLAATLLEGMRLDRRHFYCPAAKWTGTKTGVVFVGGGLDLSSLTHEEVLIAFCSWRSHPPPHDHQHYLEWSASGSHFYRGCAMTGKMIQRIEGAITQGLAGEVPYTPEAMQMLRYELAQRKKLQR